MLLEQPWLDGFCVLKGLIRQFVAMPLGQGYTAEEQLTGNAEHGGLQLVAYPMKAARYEEMMTGVRLRPPEPLYSMAPDDSPEMGLAPGGLMRQEIHEGSVRPRRSRCFVHILNSAQYREVTGCRPPHEPPTAEEYDRAGLPWFEYYDEYRRALDGAPILAGLDSVDARRVKEGHEPPAGGESLPAPARHVVKLGPNRTRDHEGRF